MGKKNPLLLKSSYMVGGDWRKASKLWVLQVQSFECFLMCLKLTWWWQVVLHLVCSGQQNSIDFYFFLREHARSCITPFLLLLKGPVLAFWQPSLTSLCAFQKGWITSRGRRLWKPVSPLEYHTNYHSHSSHKVPACKYVSHKEWGMLLFYHLLPLSSLVPLILLFFKKNWNVGLWP